MKKLKIQGFKSFADSVNLDFESGITGVVGPNGSGKSNIGDAIRWVLGEQSVKSLRGSNMQDVIFAGTEKRKPLNFAEVSLILDNSSKLLNIEYSEVNITRRIFRSGESEYFINKSPCRLKDIRQLFMDTGVGRDGYSIIGQGKIDEILSSKSEDRRNIFEEAAGIMKFKTRKIESERKLESTEQNLLRIEDIINELHLQINPLKEQSEKAKKYLELVGELKVLDINLFIESYNKLNINIENVKSDILEVERIYDDYTQKLDSSDKSYNEFIEQNKEFENDITILNREILETEKQFEKLNSDINIATEKIANSNANKERILNENILIEDKKSSLQGELDSKNQNLSQLDMLLDNANKNLLTKQEEILNINEKLNSSISQIEELKSEIIDKHNLVSTKKSNISNINVLLDNINKRKFQIESEISQLTLDNDVKNKQLESINNLIINDQKNINEINNLIVKNNSIKDQTTVELSKIADEISKANEELHKKSSRYTLLSDMEKEYQGFNKSVKSILKECEKTSTWSKDIHGVLAQLITVPKEFEIAIEVALGSTLQNIITNDEKSAQKVIEFLKVNKLGRATFLPITSVKARDFEGLENKLKSETGFVGVASDLLKFDNKYEGIVKNLLGKVLIVDTIQNGINISKKYNYSFKVVTLEGEVLMPGGSITGGSTNNTTNLLGRSREINELKADIETINEKLKTLLTTKEKLIQKQNDIVCILENKMNKKRELELELVGYEAEARKCNEQIEQLVERINMLAIESQQLIEQASDANNEVMILSDQIELITKEINEMTNKTSLNQDLYNSQVQMRDNLTKEITEMKIESSRINHEMISIKDNIERINKEITEAISQITKNQSLATLFENEILEQTDVINKKNEIIIQYNLLREQKSEELNKKIVQKNNLQLDIEKVQKSWREYNNELNEISDKRNALELKSTKYEMELETLQNRIWEEYELTITKCLEFKQDISQYKNPAKTMKDIKNQIQSLGNVNVNSIEEYKNVKERYDFLSNQRNDLESAIKSLKKVINDMVKIMKEQFLEQFKIINENFNYVFKELFGGGRANLILLDEENILDCGIEIEAQPPGKKLQNLSLLSGGERSLTGIAILFAILKVRPTPFCVLDEIEAALDDVNVYRFAEYLKRFTKDTQFLIITHRKGTMEAADTIYGVTMQEHGVSKMVSIKLEEAAV